MATKPKGETPKVTKEVKVTPKDQTPTGKYKCQFCDHYQTLTRGDGSTAILQGTCGMTKKIVWRTFSCDQFLLKTSQP